MTVSRQIAASDIEPLLLDRINVRKYGAKGDGSTDDSAAINAAIDACIAAWAAGTPNVAYLPAGRYKYVTPHATMLYPVSFLGDGHLKSVIDVDPALSGAVFSWSDVWMGTAQGTNSFDYSVNRGGVVVVGLTVNGDRSTANAQHAFVFYDRADLVFFDDVQIAYMKGRGIWISPALNRPDAYMRESYFGHVRINRCGDANVSSMEISSEGTHDSTDEITFGNLNIFGSYGPGLTIRNNNSVSALGQLKFQTLRIEGFANSSPQVNNDLLVIGDGTFAGNVNSVQFDMLELTAPPSGQYAFTIKAPNSTAGLNIYNIVVGNGYIANGAGGGLNIQAGRSLRFNLWENVATGTQLVVGAATQGIGAISINGFGLEYSWTKSIDATSVSKVTYSPLIISGNGSPAGVVAAVVGTLYQRLDGGTSTTLYVKESGTGTSGWVAK